MPEWSNPLDRAGPSRSPSKTGHMVVPTPPTHALPPKPALPLAERLSDPRDRAGPIEPNDRAANGKVGHERGPLWAGGGAGGGFRGSGGGGGGGVGGGHPSAPRDARQNERSVNIRGAASQSQGPGPAASNDRDRHSISNLVHSSSQGHRGRSPGGDSYSSGPSRSSQGYREDGYGERERDREREHRDRDRERGGERERGGDRRRSPLGHRSRSPLPPLGRERDHRDTHARDQRALRDRVSDRPSAYDDHDRARRYDERRDWRDDRDRREAGRYDGRERDARFDESRGQSYRPGSPPRKYARDGPARDGRGGGGGGDKRRRTPPPPPPPKEVVEEGEVAEEGEVLDVRPPSPSKSPSVPPPPPEEAPSPPPPPPKHEVPPPPREAPPPPPRAPPSPPPSHETPPPPSAEAPPPPPPGGPPPTEPPPGTAAPSPKRPKALHQHPSGNFAPNRNLVEPPTRVSTPVGKERNNRAPQLFRFPTAEEEHTAFNRYFKGTTTLAAYDMGSKLGEGTFGVVTKAVELATKRPVALKKLIQHNPRDGVSVTTVREIKILKELKHTNIVPILDMVVQRKVPSDRSLRGEVFMVFPYMDHDLCGLLLNKDFRMTHSTAKLLLRQILEGLAYMHRNNIIHRDLKTANILVSKEGQVMVADFGLARTLGVEPMPAHSPHEYTNMVVTRWYRAPELLLGDTQYGTAVDVWSMGCILGEMYHREPIFAGESERDQPYKVFSRAGAPNQVTWPGWDKLPGHAEMPGHPWDKTPLTTPLLQCARQWQMDRVGADLMTKLLNINPAKRPTAAEALDHHWFFVDPLPAKLGNIPSVESSHEMTSRERNPAPQATFARRPPGPPAWSQAPRPPPMAHHPPGRAQHGGSQFPRPPAYRPPPPSMLPSAPAYPSPVQTGPRGQGFAPPPFGLAQNRRGGGPPNRGGHSGHGGGGPGGPGGPGAPSGFRLAGGTRPMGPSFGGGGPPMGRPPKRGPQDDQWRPDKRPRNDGRDSSLPY